MARLERDLVRGEAHTPPPFLTARKNVTGRLFRALPSRRGATAVASWDRKRWWALGGVLALLLLLEVKRAFFPAIDKPRLLTAPVSIADVEQTVLASGIIQPSKLVSVGAQASGRIMAMHVALGD